MWFVCAFLGTLGELFVILGNTEHYRLGVSVLHLHGAARFRQYSGSFDVLNAITRPHCYPRTCGSSLPPILFGLAPDSRRLRIFDLHPMRRPARTVRRTEPLRYDAFATEFAGVLENKLAVALVVLIEHDAEFGPAHQLG